MNSKPHHFLPLKGRDISIKSTDLSSNYSINLLASLGAQLDCRNNVNQADAVRDWAESGLVALTGYPDCPMQGPAAIPSTAIGALEALKLIAKQHCLSGLNGARLLSERAAFMQLHRQGQISANSSCRLLKAKDGWIALNLAREDDWSLIPAWLECAGLDASWLAVIEKVVLLPVSQLVERGRLMGLPVAPAESDFKEQDLWFSIAASGKRKEHGSDTQPLVVDLSSLWAGPLCSHLLLKTGARVIKVESKKRPDGARQGNKDFFDLLNAGKESVVLDLSQDKGRQQLLLLISKADIVIEGSRPRALKQLGINAEELVKTEPGLTWISVTGYGREEPEANWVAFGDDAAVAAGVAMSTTEPPLFCGDALADPLTGIHAALAALAFWQGGGGVLVDLSLRGVTAHCLNFCSDVERGEAITDGDGWQLALGEKKFPVKFPECRYAETKAAIFGRDTEKIVKEFQLPC